MRLGAPVFIDNGHDPEIYAAEHVRKGYRAAYCPDWINADTDPELCAAFKSALAKHDVVLAEVGIWKNVMSKDPAEAKAAFEWAVRRLQTAEELEARCAVNIIGTWSTDSWDGPSPLNYTKEFFDYGVEMARKVIDAVNPRKTKMTFEIMPCHFIDSAEEYLRFIKAVDRTGAGVHLDPANSISSPRLLYDNAAFFRNQFRIFGDAVVSIHLKDLHLNPNTFTVNLDEVVIGRGDIDYINLLRLIDKLPPDTPGMLEHLDTEALYDEAAASIRSLAAEAGVRFR
jgi:sugar phosphate isomerase/epimerase